MSATDELRDELTKRGVEWEARTSPVGSIWTYWDAFNGHRIYARDNENGTVKILGEWDVTPEQAIAATLGAGTCELSGYADAAFRVVQAVDQQDFIDYAEVCECSACGASFIVPHEYERIAPDEDELWPKFNYCPNCGREVVDE